MKKNITTEIIIHASKERVWNILTDFEHYDTWNPFIIQSSGKAVVDTRLINKMKNKEKTITFKPKVLTVEPYKYFDWLGTLFIRGLFDGHHYFKIEDLGDGQVKVTQGEDFSGILSGMILRSIGDDTRNNFILMNKALKELAEGS